MTPQPIIDPKKTLVSQKSRKSRSIITTMPGALYRSFPKEDLADSFKTLGKALIFQDQTWGMITWLSVIGLSGYSAVTSRIPVRKKRRRIF